MSRLRCREPFSGLNTRTAIIAHAQRLPLLDEADPSSGSDWSGRLRRDRALVETVSEAYHVRHHDAYDKRVREVDDDRHVGIERDEPQYSLEDEDDCRRDADLGYAGPSPIVSQAHRGRGYQDREGHDSPDEMEEYRHTEDRAASA